MVLRLQPLGLPKHSLAPPSAVAGAKAGWLAGLGMLPQRRRFALEGNLDDLQRELRRREGLLAGREEELDKRLREVALLEEDLRGREGLFRRADPGDMVDSYLTCDHADIAWSLTREDILGTNEAYPLESLWCTRGRLRCRLVVHSQGHYVNVSLTPAAVTGVDLKAFELSCTLKLMGEEAHVIERLDLSVNEKDWHGNSLAVELGRCPDHIFVELQIHKFVGLLREGGDHFANQGVPYSATELVPSRERLVLGEEEHLRGHSDPALIEP